MAEPLQDRFDVTIDVPAENGLPALKDTYTFRLPNMRYDNEVAYQALDVRMRSAPNSSGIIGGLDMTAVQFARYCAIIELYLLRATTPWPWGYLDEDFDKIDFNKPPQIDFLKFPLQAYDDIWRVGQAFETEYGRFRTRRHPNRPSAGTEAVGSQRDPGAQEPVRQGVG